MATVTFQSDFSTTQMFSNKPKHRINYDYAYVSGMATEKNIKLTGLVAQNISYRPDYGNWGTG